MTWQLLPMAFALMQACQITTSLPPRPMLPLLQIGVLVIGTGPTSLGAATRLNQHGLKTRSSSIRQALCTGCHWVLHSFNRAAAHILCYCSS